MVNIAVLVLLLRRNSSYSAIVPIMTGSCASLKHTSLFVHLAINIASTLLLSGSNYCMQCVSAPTRKDIDKAHEHRLWLDIAVPSVRNMRVLGCKRLLLWGFMGLSSIPLHLFYNSAFFLSTIHHSKIDVLIGTSEFAQGAPFFNPSGEQLVAVQNSNGVLEMKNHTFEPHTNWSSIQTNSSQLQHLDNRECITAYTQRILSDRSNLILVVSNTPRDDSFAAAYDNKCQNPRADIIHVENVDYGSDLRLKAAYPYVFCQQNSSLFTYFSWYIGFWTYGTGLPAPFTWICNYDEDCGTLYQGIRDNPSTWTVFGFTVDHCLSQTSESPCSFNAAISILVVVIILNTFKVVAMGYTLHALQDKPLITIGDAIESFLVQQDLYTTGKHLLTAQEVRSNGFPSSVATESHWDPVSSGNVQPRWWQSASKARWSLAYFGLFLCMVALVSLTIFAIYTANADGVNASEVFQLGIGTLDPRTLISFMKWPSGDSATILSILVANSPQLLFSFLYLIFNTLFTSMSLAIEWSRYHQHPRSLRVSHRKGEQRSTYFLQIPYRLGIPVMIFSTVLHWLISQSIFLAKIDDMNFPNSVSTCGYSIGGMIATFVGGLILAVFAIILGSRRLPSGMPLVGSCSLAIAASCHTPDSTSELQPLKWGPLPTEERGKNDKVGPWGFHNPLRAFDS
ncbi:hypothetical protein DL96DRAFT_1751300 [Flagelloscypha sp. PMI_526]|nr:hypothetical protein DL96DRAFT_1751300 [Flagelloscypha sp. PMI_526]